MSRRDLAREIIRGALEYLNYQSLDLAGWESSAISRYLPHAEFRAGFVSRLWQEVLKYPHKEAAGFFVEGGVLSGKETGREIVDAVEFQLESDERTTADLSPDVFERPRLKKKSLELLLRSYASSYPIILGGGASVLTFAARRRFSWKMPYDNASLVQVFYATDRREMKTNDGGIRYDKRRASSGQLQYGECEISIPKIHKVGSLETPSIWRLEFRPNPKKHIVLAKIENLKERIFFERVASRVALSSSREAFVFVHGYNVSFDSAARRTGQIAYDLNFVGAPILYSWPSNGKVKDYVKDETNITWSTPHFERFLTFLAQRSGAARIHIIAHSMGNRAVCDALKSLSYQLDNQLKVNHLVLAAPDIDADTFRELAATLRKLSGRVTLYESSNDRAIQASKKIHGNPRAGEPLLVIPGLDTIDASAIDTDFLGHSYFSETWPLLSDIYSIVSKDDPPSNRFGLAEMESPDGRYYAFRA